MQQSFRQRFIGNRAFYGMVLAIVVPIIIQNAITNFVSLLDNLMVGRIGTEPMSGVAIANQLIFVFNLAIYGGISGAGIFSAQYHGAGETEGVRASFRYKIYLALILTVLSLTLFCLFGPQLISLYLNEGDDPVRVAQTLQYALDYLRIMLWGLLPFAISQAYAGTLRETGETRLPMRASVLAVFINLIFNYLLIFGTFGFPRLGVRGAAIATVISRYVELAVIVIYTHTHTHIYAFAHRVYRHLGIPLHTVREITVKGMPLMANELLWSLSMALLSQIYSLRGLDVVAAMNISNTVYNLFSVVFLSLGSATAIIVGQELGGNRIEQAKDYAWKLIFFSVSSSVCIGLLLMLCSGSIPLLYVTSDAVHHLATRFIIVCAVSMPLSAFVHATYFIMRSGGKTGITFLFDCGFCWVIEIPTALLLTHLTSLGIVEIYLIIHMTELLKCVMGYMVVKGEIWVHNIIH